MQWIIKSKMVFGILSGIVKVLFGIFRFVLDVLENIFSWFYNRIKFILDILKEENKSMAKIKSIVKKERKMIRLNDEV